MGAFSATERQDGRIKVIPGGGYLLFDTHNTFEVPIDLPEFTGEEFHSTLCEASILLNFDSRNNVFTPTKGFFLQISGTYSDTWFGGDALYGRLIFDTIAYFPVSQRVFVGTRFLNNYTLWEVPFNARPTIRLRGVPLVKFQDRNTMEFETEVTVNLTNRWSVWDLQGWGTHIHL